jgi:hypothetical protein
MTAKFKPMRTLGQRIAEPETERFKPSQNFAGHSMYCSKCRDFKVQCFKLIGNGTPILEMRCYTCGTPTNFEFVAGGWVPESVVDTLENFVSTKLDATISVKQESEKADADAVIEQSVIELPTEIVGPATLANFVGSAIVRVYPVPLAVSVLMIALPFWTPVGDLVRSLALATVVALLAAGPIVGFVRYRHAAKRAPAKVRQMNRRLRGERRARHKAKLKGVVARVLGTRVGGVLARAFRKIRGKGDAQTSPPDAISTFAAQTIIRKNVEEALFDGIDNF